MKDDYELLADDGNPFHQLLGPVYHRPDVEGMGYRWQVRRQHLNQLLILHGGALAALLDITMGSSVHQLAPVPADFLTASLNIDFVGPTREGDWLDIVVVLPKSGRKLSFVRCEVRSGDQLIAQASGVWFARGSRS